MNKNIEMALKLKRWVHPAHHIPGRIRLKYKLGIIAHLARFNSKDIEHALDSIPAFKNYQLNSRTSSILIEYDPQVVNPAHVDALFSEDNVVVEQACIDLAYCLDIEGTLS